MMLNNHLQRVLLVASVAMGTATLAADDPSIQGKLRLGVQESMSSFIDQQTVNGIYRHYDPVSGELLVLTPGEVHAGIVKKGDFFVSCADFVDHRGREVDMDFLVVQDGDRLLTVQGLVHKVDGKKRPYHLESK
ncbi:MAG: hypothetical protein K0U98_13685 [Deltaproteobacteria bacterium]|nr:hypothetical protein [Deltaproteobacteria bacterium]